MDESPVSREGSERAYAVTVTRTATLGLLVRAGSVQEARRLVDAAREDPAFCEGLVERMADDDDDYEVTVGGPAQAADLGAEDVTAEAREAAGWAEAPASPGLGEEAATGVVCDALREIGFGHEAQHPRWFPSDARRGLLRDEFWSPRMGILVTRRADPSNPGETLAFDVRVGVTEGDLAAARKKAPAAPSLSGLLEHLDVRVAECVRADDDLGVARLWTLVSGSQDVIEETFLRGKDALWALDATRELRARLPVLVDGPTDPKVSLDREEAVSLMGRDADFLTVPARAQDGIYVRCVETPYGATTAQVLTGLSANDYADIAAYHESIERGEPSIPERLVLRLLDAAYEVPLCLKSGEDAVADLVVGAGMLNDRDFCLAVDAREARAALRSRPVGPRGASPASGAPTAEGLIGQALAGGGPEPTAPVRAAPGRARGM